MILRPYGVVVSGRLEIGLELLLDGDRIVEVRPHTGIPEPYVLSSAFVNAHSHLEYRGLQGQIHEPEYWGWIRELTRLKAHQTPDQVRQDCHQAARENRATGVAVIAEHSDRPFAGEAMRSHGLQGTIFQEVITILEEGAREEKLRLVERNAQQNREAFQGPVRLNPHAYQTVDDETLRCLAQHADSLSVHVAESCHESDLTREGAGPMAEFYRRHGVPFEPAGKGVVETLGDLGYLRPGVQFVHCCSIEDEDIDRIAAAGVSVAHCPRSNERLACPPAPIRELLDAGVRLGLGLDSAASSGPVDMFEEMRAALKVSQDRRRPLTPEEIWSMATTAGYDSIRPALSSPLDRWDVAPGSNPPLIKIHVEGALDIRTLLESATPSHVEWLGLSKP